MHFFALVKSESHLAAVCGEPIRADKARIRLQVRRAVEVFLRGYSTESKSGKQSPKSSRPSLRRGRSSK